MAKIFVVEDDPSTQLLIASALEKEGHEVVLGSDGHEALLQIDHAQPDLLISDINLPGQDGYELVKELRSHPHWADLPIIFLTSLAQRANVRAGMNTGADDYITKPFSLRELREAVQTQLRKRQTQEQLHQELVSDAVEQVKEEISVKYEQRLHETVSRLWGEVDPKRGWTQMDAAVVLTGIKHHTRYSEVLSPDQYGDLMHRYFETMLDAVQLFDPVAVQLTGGGVLAVFASQDEASSMSKELKAWRAVQSTQAAANRFRMASESLLRQLGMPSFEACVVMHCGNVQLLGVNSIAQLQVIRVPIGDAINVTRDVYKKMSPIWRMTASEAMVAQLGKHVRVANRANIHVPPRQQPLGVCEVLPLEAI